VLFQTLDSKQECVGVYNDGALLYGEDRIKDGFSGTRTWTYASYLEGYDIEYADLYCGRGLDDACPDHLKEDWKFVNKKLQAFMRSIFEAKVSLEDNCFYDLVPERFLKDYCFVKNAICQHVFESYEKPDNYEHLLGAAKLLHKISLQKVNLNWSNMRNSMHKSKVRQDIKKLRHLSPYCRYNLFGTKTGRLTTKKGGFPILTLPKDYRKSIRPSNDSFISLDFNGAELRTLLALGGSEQPVEDIHEWNKVNVFGNTGSREEAKKRLFSWLYNPDSSDRLLERAYNRQELVQKHWNGTTVSTPFGRNIAVDKRRALNYLIQSTTSDMVVEQAIKIDKMLRGCRSRIAFIIHDEIILDVAKEDSEIIRKAVQTFGDTRFGKYMVGVKTGLTI
tara:strand:+ start:1754 stop:2926 length:1173 start_codon:yes stop_codon:yes gene_type:complete